MAIRKTSAIALTGITLAATSSFALAQQQPDGLYSADQLLDAEVYMQGSDKSVGEIDDVILDNNMSIKSFVVETENDFGLDGQSYVVQPNQLSVETLQGDKATEPEYRITLNAEGQELGGYPVYNDTWWNTAQTQASDAWEQTKESASNAWTRIKEGTSDLIDSTRDATSDAADDTGDAAENAADETEDAADDATN
ncbi:PRC-barrel domain-containing protein [Endozoicomonas sp. G2_2]|uniref:PRC-barrel domain-containing protein n=1 Tax=Gammaproteobacteria TaxID=1236 RepID=UPI000C6207E3|nr:MULTISPECIES: PRC-barrel domain-containing protein [Gammaproteobacteria]MAS11296.1 hypothetical protein [Salinisphaera sp.]MBO9469341.1 PRC-barrel domain-containing protein [Endozoicomonas sp. G2_2]